ncbi:hypothetical protein, partial [Paenibacillus ginsengarvi]|uniref:hypothetical protein n=1 Tax=Paenibacillus ginsengarvi TaxID=400777 RepID=UPI001960EE6E
MDRQPKKAFFVSSKHLFWHVFIGAALYNRYRQTCCFAAPLMNENIVHTGTGLAKVGRTFLVSRTRVTDGP